MVVGGRGGGWLGMKQNELIPRVLGIPRNSNLFQDIQMRKHKNVWNIWEYLRIDENTSGNFSEFLGIPNHWKFGGNCLWNLWELLEIAKTHWPCASSCSPRGRYIWIFLCSRLRYLTANSDEKDWHRTYVSCFHTSRIHDTVCNDLEIMEASKNKQKLSGFCCFVFKFCLF